MWIRGWLVVLAAFVATPLFAKPQIEWNTAYDFGSIKTFQWQDPPGASLKDTDPFLHAHIINAIEYELTARGLTEVAENPDVFVTYAASTQTSVRLESDTFGYGFGSYGLGTWGRFGYGYGFRRPIGPAVTTTTRVVEVERGTLVVDIWAAASRELVWRGTVVGIAVAATPDRNRRNVEKAIRAMAKQARSLQTRAR